MLVLVWELSEIWTSELLQNMNLDTWNSTDFPVTWTSNCVYEISTFQSLLENEYFITAKI